jgi:putative heme iron utilization protein
VTRSLPAGDDGLFTPEVVAAISRHMNDDHAADSLLICRSLGGRPAATGARMTGLDAAGIDFTVTVPGGTVPVRVPFAQPVTERAEVRREVVRLYRQACALLGVPARPAG